LKRYNAGDYKGAITSFSLGSKIIYDFSLLYDQALCYEALSDYKQAESLYSQSLRKNPRFSPAYEKLIRLHLSNKTSTDGYIRAKELIDNAILANIVDNNKILMDLKIEIDTYTSRKQV
jgi:tetratricopeptide (TPR) repeat protein